jgi:hypothetical protein
MLVATAAGPRLLLSRACESCGGTTRNLSIDQDATGFGVTGAAVASLALLEIGDTPHALVGLADAGGGGLRYVVYSVTSADDAFFLKLIGAADSPLCSLCGC